MDSGLARSGNRHTARDLAAALGAGHAYGVEFARGPALLVSLHLESASDPAARHLAVGRLLSVLPPEMPAVVAGDLNTAALPDPAAEPDLGWFERPKEREPLFGAMRNAGFDWLRCNAPDQTRRAIPDGRRAPRVRRVDWFFVRGLDAADPRTWAATDEDGAPLSDHELITVDVG